MLKIVRVEGRGLVNPIGREREVSPDHQEGQFVVLEGEAPGVILSELRWCFYGKEELPPETTAHYLGVYGDQDCFSCSRHLSLALTEDSLRKQLGSRYRQVIITPVDV